jgi:rhodanese-related sulfurtransferase
MKEWDTDAMDGMSREEFAEPLGADLDMPIVIYSEDLASPRSHTAAYWASKLGFTNVSRYAGGIRAWKAAGNETRSTDNRS